MTQIENINDLGRSIKTIRKQAGLSQQQLADIVGLSRTAIQSVETGYKTPGIDTIITILNGLNIKMHVEHPLLDRGDKQWKN